ncbi:MAG: hypothetical protein KJ592_00170 [Nanoarchaeota archaeon]|nr:hypothetical protein [Nanoarchaeota archaeon]
MIPNIIIGGLIVIINLLPLITRQYKYLLLTSLLSVLMIYGYLLFGVA